VAGGSQVLVLTDSHACWFNQPTFQTPNLYPSSGFRTIMTVIRVGLGNAGRFDHHKRLPAQEMLLNSVTVEGSRHILSSSPRQV
jgi:hypothetical protein